MANYNAKRVIYNVETNIGFRLRALVYGLRYEGCTLSGIHDLLDKEYLPSNIDKAYAKRFELPRCSTYGKE